MTQPSQFSPPAVGSATYNAVTRKWTIEGPPHIVLKAKRVFGKLSARSHKSLELSDSIETARDLEWFCERYPLDVFPADYLAQRAGAHRDRESLVEAMLSRRIEAPHFDLAIPPREYQRVAAGLLLANGGLLLADDVGLGKTASAICTFADVRTLPALVVTLTHLPRQWEAEIARFAPKLRTHIIRKGKPYDIANFRGRGNQLGLPSAFPDVVIINYHKLAGWAETLAPLVRSVVFDECQELRSGYGGRDTPAKYSAARHIAEHCDFRLGLSATPIYNYGGEFFSVLDVLQPGHLGTHQEFITEWCETWGDKPRIKDPKAFGTHARSSGIMLRRTRQDVGRELPGLQKVSHHIDADTAALDRIDSACAELARIILGQGESHPGQKMQASEELSNRLRQATGIAKAPFVAEFVRLLVESGEKVVLFGWHREVYSIWLDRLKDLDPVMYTGSESHAQKEASRAAFVNGTSKVLIMSLRSGAGLDGLQDACRTVVFGELDWSPGVHEQCTGRVARDGQEHPVVAYFLVADEGSDPIVADVLGVKTTQIEGSRDPNADLFEKLDVDHDRIKRLASSYLARRGETTEAA